MNSDANRAFARALTALRPYLDQLVIAGGWAHRLYTLHERGRPPGFIPLTTEAADIAAPARISTIGESMDQLLLGDEDGAFYLEFIVPLTGSGQRRDGSRDATTTIAGVTAQKLRYVDILISDPWKVRISENNGFPVEPGLDIRIANPVSYLAQKLLILPERPPKKQAKDVLYIHDTLLILADCLEDLRPLWKTLSATVHPNVRRKIDERRGSSFADVTDAIRGAAQIASSTGRADSPSPARVAAVCRFGLRRIFD